ncbi:hypothetical protein ERX27_09650 [Macrococcus brunensis]|uniref:Uncharacterized protein n=1 Tax=Macrococcus brunensis TaxID=198483 RepID=A0A4R6BB49_9STAP|nr:hypothetical protein [Macrococcus brunensis]TDL94191.1 hypothetical protein ERX27_09650 [Macrococcus brunensis]
MLKIMVQVDVQPPATTEATGGAREVESVPKIGDSMELQDRTKGVVTAVEPNDEGKFDSEENIEAIVTVQVSE